MRATVALRVHRPWLRIFLPQKSRGTSSLSLGTHPLSPKPKKKKTFFNGVVVNKTKNTYTVRVISCATWAGGSSQFGPDQHCNLQGRHTVPTNSFLDFKPEQHYDYPYLIDSGCATTHHQDANSMS